MVMENLPFNVDTGEIPGDVLEFDFISEVFRVIAKKHERADLATIVRVARIRREFLIENGKKSPKKKARGGDSPRMKKHKQPLSAGDFDGLF